MAYTVTVLWVAKEGNEDEVAQIIREVGPLSRAEPGCLLYQAHRSPEDPRQFFIYEQYADEAAFQAHRDSEHFQRLVLGDALPLLESRDRTIYETMD